MELTADVKLTFDQVIPQFTLPDVVGRQISTWDFKQRKNLVIFFLHNARCAACRWKLDELADMHQKLVDLRTQALAVALQGPGPENWTYPFPLLYDNGEVARLYGLMDSAGGRKAAILVADRFGALYDYVASENEEDLFDAGEIIYSIQHIESACPECSV